MAYDPGKNDLLCTHVREQTAAVAAIVIVVDGMLGSGFSVQAPPDVADRLPEILRSLARQIEASRTERRPD